ncbi:DNA/RNA non-specific endonuclease [Clostridium sp. JS66]|uniref:DNA/RNA non-specific endonuclease n=1 Tax=Clostridium sp. JS66 TaxID=3064705 RepID=UPI00298E60F1|nr:DNA/RNA non-specific endonuclease [Clostridium sp. JS66]WPC42633.1 DNA/RNA non-specific endonuclease [Clostridium sp. JS66]
METKWTNVLKDNPPKKVSVEIKPVYGDDTLRPSGYTISYKIVSPVSGEIEKEMKNVYMENSNKSVVEKKKK